MQTNINPFQAAIYYNAYIIKSVYFRCRIIKLTVAQEIELKRIYEILLLMKLGLGQKFSQKVLYSRKSTLEVGIITPKTIIDILKAKLYIGNVRKREETSKVIELYSELMNVESGREIGIGFEPQQWYWHRTWIDIVSDIFYSRNIKLIQEKRN